MEIRFYPIEVRTSNKWHPMFKNDLGNTCHILLNLIILLVKSLNSNGLIIGVLR